MHWDQGKPAQSLNEGQDFSAFAREALVCSLVVSLDWNHVGIEWTVKAKKWSREAAVFDFETESAFEYTRNTRVSESLTGPLNKSEWFAWSNRRCPHVCGCVQRHAELADAADGLDRVPGVTDGCDGVRTGPLDTGPRVAAEERRLQNGSVAACAPAVLRHSPSVAMSARVQ